MGPLFLASFPRDWSDRDAMLSLFSGKHSFYFLGIELVPRKWYWPFLGTKKTGEVWCPEDPREFDVLVV